MQTSAINTLPIYQNSDPLDYGAQQSAVQKAIDSRVVARFATKAAADSAYSAYTAQGGVLSDGMVRAIGGYLETYRAGGWRGVMPVTRTTLTFFETTYSNGDEVGVATLAIPDLGTPSYVDVSGAVTVSATTGAQVRGVIRLDAIEGTIASRIANRSGQLPNGELIDLTFPPYRIGPISGAHNLIVGIRRVLGTGQWYVPAGGNYLRADITAN